MELEKYGGKPIYYKCDVSNYQEVEKIVAKTYSDMKKIDILVNNAGIVAGKSVLDLSIQEIEKVTGFQRHFFILYKNLKSCELFGACLFNEANFA